MNIGTGLQKHDALLLGMGSPWEVKTVELKLQGKKVEVEPGWQWGQRPGVRNATGSVRSMTARARPGARSQNEAGSAGLTAGTLHAAL